MSVKTNYIHLSSSANHKELLSKMGYNQVCIHIYLYRAIIVYDGIVMVYK